MAEDKKIRSAAVVISQGRLLVMFRRRSGKEYYVFPGGGMEENENAAQAAVRETKEETCVDVQISRLLYEGNGQDGQKEFFWLGDYISGQPCLSPDSIESRINSPENYYQPQWLALGNLGKTELYPLEIRDRLIHDLKEGRVDCN